MEKLNPKGQAKGTGFTPGNPGDWQTQPTTAQEALDELAAQEAAGEVKNVTATAPLASTGGANPNISIAAATQSQPGSMSAVDKAKLDNLPANPVTSVGGTAPITSTGGPTPNIGITPATDLAAGSMSAADKAKLDNLSAPTVPYTPTTPGDWSPPPNNAGAALDQLAARPQGGGGSGNVFVYRELEPSPSGNVFSTFDGAYAAAQASLPAEIVIDSTYGDPAVGNACGQGGFVQSVSGSTATLTRLFGMHAGLVGKSIGIYNAQTPGPGTNGLFTITAVLSSKTIQISNAAAIVDDTFDWSLVAGTTASKSAGPGPLVLIQNAGLPNGTNTPGGAFSPASVGQTVTLANTGSPGNSGTFPIVAYVSPTSVWIANASSSSPDGGQLVQASGASASIVSFDSVHNTAVITGLSNIPAYTTGWLLVLRGSASNDGNWSIARTLSPTSVEIQFFGGTVPDANNGSIQWTLSGQGIQLNAAFYSTIAVTGLVGVPSSAVGNALSIANTTSTPRAIGAIIGWIDSTSVLVNPVNSAFAAPDSNNGSLWWYLGTNYDLSRITLLGSTVPNNGSFLQVRDGATFNQGIAAIRHILDLEPNFILQPYIGTLALVGPFSTELYVSDESFFAGGTNPAFDLSWGSESTLYVWVDSESQVDNVVYFDDNPNVSLGVTMASGGTLGTNLLTGTAGQLTIDVLDAADNPPRISFPNFYGTSGSGINITYRAKAAALVPFAQSGNPAPNTGSNPQGRYNVDVGTMYYDTGANQPFWWSGSAWVSYQPAVPGAVTFGHITPASQGYNLTGNQFGAAAFAGDGTNFGVVLLASDNAGFSAVTGNYVTVCGGNGVRVNVDFAFIGGGYQNTAFGETGYHVLVGGQSNIINDAGGYSFIGGGQLNSTVTGGSYNIIVGGYQNAISASALAIFNTIGGGQQNRITGLQNFSTIAGGNQNAITSTDGSFASANSIGGGEGNSIGQVPYPGIHHATIAGGGGNTILAIFGFVGGGTNNIINPAAQYATVVGGQSNSSNSPFGFVGGGFANSVLETHGVVVGGEGNTVQSGSDHGFLGGGKNNSVNGTHGIVVGGENNQVQADYGVIIGGSNHRIFQRRGFIPAGQNSIVGAADGTVLGTSGYVWNETSVVHSGGGAQWLNQTINLVMRVTTDGVNAGTYQMTFGDDGTGVATQNTIAFPYGQPGLFQVIVEAVAANFNTNDMKGWTKRFMIQTMTSPIPQIANAADIIAPWSSGGGNTGTWDITANGIAPYIWTLDFTQIVAEVVSVTATVRITQLTHP